MKNTLKTIMGLIVAMMLVVSPAYATNDEHGDNRSDRAKEVHNVGSTLEVHISDNGKVLVRGAKVTAINGTTINADTLFGDSNISWVVDASATPKVIRRYGGNSSVSEIAIGDFISFNGTLNATGAWNVKATNLKDWSIQVKNSSFSGTISSISGASFVLATENGKSVTVNTDANTKIMKGDATVAFSTLVVGDKISKTEGLYNNNTTVLQAKTVKLYVNPVINKRTFEGKITSTVSILPPTSFTFDSEGKTYTVNVPLGISILNKDWAQVLLSSFQVNDTVRVYGQVQATNTSVIDATVVRNASR
jgi:hypothetical protein